MDILAPSNHTITEFSLKNAPPSNNSKFRQFSALPHPYMSHSLASIHFILFLCHPQSLEMFQQHRALNTAAIAYLEYCTYMNICITFGK